MKRAVLAFFLFALVIALIQYLLIQQKNIEIAVYEQMGTAARALESGDMELADEEFWRTNALWEHYEPQLVAIVGRSHTDPITISLARAQSLLENREPAEYLAELAQLQKQVKSIWNSELFAWENFL
jgi:hypothetical protein